MDSWHSNWSIQWLSEQVNIDWTGILLERVTNLSLEEYLKQNIFNPLGLTKISMLPDASMRSKLANMNQRWPDGQLSARDHLLRRRLSLTGPEDAKLCFLSGGAGCFAKPQEYCRKWFLSH